MRRGASAIIGAMPRRSSGAILALAFATLAVLVAWSFSVGRFAVAPGDVLQVTLRGRMHGYFVPPSTTENHVYISPVRVEFEPRN